MGVVGPRHSGGNSGILTYMYDFVHRTHIDVLGYYYRRAFTDWWADNWMTNVYVQGRTKKMDNVRVAHTMGTGQRYEVQRNVYVKLFPEITKARKL